MNSYDEELAEAILEEYYRFEGDLRRAVQNMMAKLDASAVKTRNNTFKEYFVSFYDVPSSVRYARCSAHESTCAT